MKPPGFSGSITTSMFSFSRRLRLAWAFLPLFYIRRYCENEEVASGWSEEAEMVLEEDIFGVL
jgi:hypothetical protein